MSLSEQISLDVGGVIGPALQAAAAVGKLSAELKGLQGTKASDGGAASKAAEIQAKGSVQAELQRQKDLAASVMAAQKSRVAQEMEAGKQAAASAMAAAKSRAAAESQASKQASAAGLAAAKAESTARMAQLKAVNQVLINGHKQAHASAMANIKAEAAAKAASAKGEQESLKLEQKRLDLLKQESKEREKAASAASKAAKPGAGGGGGGGGGAGGGGDVKGIGKGLDDLVNMGEAAGAVAIVKQVWGAIFGLIQSAIGGAMSLTLLSQGFKDDALDSFEVLLGGEKEANAMYEKIIKVSHELGLSKEEAIGETKRLLAAGYKAEQIPKMLEAIADLNMTREGGGAKLEKVLENIKGKGKLDKGSVAQLGKLGISEADLYAKLAEQQHKSVAEVKAMVKAGTIDANKGIDAVLAAAESKFGGRAKKDAEDVQTLLMTIRSQLMELFDSIDIGPLQKVLKDVRDVLDSDLGKEMKGAFTEMMNALFEALFGPLQDKGRLEGIVKTFTSVFKSIAGFIKEAAPSVKAFVKGFQEGFGAAWPAIKAVASALMSMFGVAAGSKGAAAQVGEFLGKLVGGVILVVGVVGGAVGTIVAAFAGIVVGVMTFWNGVTDILGEIPDALMGAWVAVAEFWAGVNSTIAEVWDGFASAPDQAFQAGSDLISGFANGIAGNAGAVVDAVIGAAGDAIQAAKRILGIASPSKVFTEIGGFTAEGMAGGIDKGAHRVAGAAKRMAGSAIAAGSGGRVPSVRSANDNGGADGAGGGGELHLHIHIEGGKDPQAQAEAVAHAVETDPRIRAFLRRRVAGGR